MESTMRTPRPAGFDPIISTAPLNVTRDVTSGKSGSGQPGLAVTPSIAVVWLTAAGLVAWSLFESSGTTQLLALMVLTVVAATSISLRGWMTGGAYDVPDTMMDTLAILGVASVAGAAIVAGTVLGPFLLVLPIMVAITAASARQAFVADAALVLAIVAVGAVGIRMVSLPDGADRSTLLFLGTVAAMGVLARVAGERLRTVDFKPATKVRTPAGSTDFTGQQVDALESAESPLELFRAAVDILQDSARPSYVAIVERIPETDVLRPLIERGALEVDADNLRAGLATHSHESLADGRVRQLLSSGRDLDSVACRRLGVDALLIVPLRRLGEGLGAIHFAWKQLDDPAKLPAARDFALKLTPWIAPDLAIARVAGEIERGYLSAMVSLSATLDSRDVHSDGHSRRVARLSLEIADLLRLPDHDQRQLIYAAEIHDLGRIGVRPDIFSKPEALTDEEWSQVKMIPTIGAKIIERVSFFGDVSQAIQHVRERWDGQGYPDGLFGNEIPLLARILAVADAFDAMTSPRPYRNAIPEQDALRQLWLERGKAFDPEVVEALVKSRTPRNAVPA